MTTRKVSYLNDVHYLLLCSCLLVENICSQVRMGGGGGGGGRVQRGILLIKKKMPFAPGTQNEISGKFSPQK